MTFFIQAPIDSAIASHALEYSFEPVMGRLPEMKMPVIKIPRSAKRKYDDGELASAALMMEKLKRREDMSVLAAKSVDSEIAAGGCALDAAIEKLIDALR